MIIEAVGKNYEIPLPSVSNPEAVRRLRGPRLPEKTERRGSTGTKTAALLQALLVGISATVAGFGILSGVRAVEAKTGFHAAASGPNASGSGQQVRNLWDDQSGEEWLASRSLSRNGNQSRNVVQQLQPRTWALQRQRDESARRDRVSEEALRCLSLNIYHESRGEPLAGQFAVALVTMNRAQWDKKRVCSEVYKPSQFSWTLSQERLAIKPGKNNEAWQRALRIAKLTMDRRVKDITYGSTHFHAVYVDPYWSKQFKYIAKIGQHKFYRMET